MDAPAPSAPSAAATAVAVPCLDVTTWGGDARALCSHRVDVNRWLLTVGSAAGAVGPALAGDHARSLPSMVLDELSGQAHGELVQLTVELDLCGAWLTVANAGDCRPVALRRAGWVDLRGHPAPPLGSGHAPYCDDRVGLGPGDGLVLLSGAQHRSLPAGKPPQDGDLLDALLEANSGQRRPDAAALAGAFAEAGIATDPVVPLVVIAVPEQMEGDRHGDLAHALGVDREELDLPGYPLGDLQPDLWSHPPEPPRTARLRLHPATAKLEDVRALLLRMLASWRLEERVAAHDVTLLATEVVANALRHAETVATVTVRYTGPGVQVTVVDGSSDGPVLLSPHPLRRGGRGMFLVDAMAEAWGTEQLPGGKVVWFQVPVTSVTG